MGLFGKLLKTAVDVVTIPVDVVKDVVTLGGSITDEPSAVGSKLGKLADDVEEIKYECDDL